VHSNRAVTECKAVVAEPEDPPLRPLATALLKLLATPNTPTQAQPQPGSDSDAVPLTMAALAHMVELMDDKMRAGLGARLVAKAWVDAAFKAWLLAQPAEACASVGIKTSNYGEGDVSLYPIDPAVAGQQIQKFASGHTLLQIYENTPEAHHLIVCTLCSCYPSAVLGQSPEWYKSRYYRSRAVREPRKLLAEDFGLTIAKSRSIVVHDSTAEIRYMVLPMRPEGTEGWSEEKLRTIVTRDSLLGVAECSASRRQPEYEPRMPKA
jgi:nitrile hydratase